MLFRSAQVAHQVGQVSSCRLLSLVCCGSSFLLSFAEFAELALNANSDARNCARHFRRLIDNCGGLRREIKAARGMHIR